jgi:hypothetical protein
MTFDFHLLKFLKQLPGTQGLKVILLERKSSSSAPTYFFHSFQIHICPYKAYSVGQKEKRRLLQYQYTGMRRQETIYLACGKQSRYVLYMKANPTRTGMRKMFCPFLCSCILSVENFIISQKYECSPVPIFFVWRSLFLH